MRWLWRRSPRRTLLLGIAALGVLLWGAVTQFDLPRERVLDALLATLMALGLVICLAALSAAAWVMLKRLRRRDD
jgi:hypothetical protein